MPDSTTPKLPPDLQKRSDAATVDEAEAKARKAVAEASDAEQTSALNRLKGSTGEPMAGPFTGDVTLADGAALAEANAVARSELKQAAAIVAEAVGGAVGDRSVVYLTAADGPPDLSHDSALTSRMALVNDAVTQACRLSDDALTPVGTFATERSMITAPLAATGLVLSGVSALLGYFKTDFKIGSDEVKVSDRDLLVLVGSALVGRSKTVFMDGFPPAPDKAVISAVEKQLLDLSAAVTTLRGRLAVHDAAIAAVDRAAAAKTAAEGAEGGEQEQDGTQVAAEDPATVKSRAAHEEAKAACAAATTVYDAFIASLDADAGGIAFLERALRERRLRMALGDEAAIVTLKIDGSWATHVVRKSLFSGLFGKIPVRLSATVGASWAAYDFDSGSFLGGGIETSRSGLTDIVSVKDGERSNANSAGRALSPYQAPARLPSPENRSN